jgi:hypothetical protein
MKLLRLLAIRQETTFLCALLILFQKSLLNICFTFKIQADMKTGARLSYADPGRQTIGTYYLTFSIMNIEGTFKMKPSTSDGRQPPSECRMM